MNKTRANISSSLPQARKMYHIRNWRKYQHYKRRNPPWVKLHNKIFNSEDWLNWPDATRLTALCCLVVGSMYDGCVPNDTVLIKKLCHLNWRVDLQPLINSGFLSENASILPAQHERMLAALPSRDRDRDRDRDRVEVRKKERVLEVANKHSLPQENGSDTKPRKKHSGEQRGSRLPEAWKPTPEGQTFAVERLGEGAAAELDKFRDYWLAVPGARGRKLDWDRTWLNWCRNANGGPYNGPRGSGALQENPRSFVAAGKRLIESSERGEFSFDPIPKSPLSEYLSSQEGNGDLSMLPKK